MSWGAPLAWVGLAAVAVPLLVHLLARRTTKRVAFPTLRFIDPSRLTPTRRRRLTDPWLLALRIAIVVMAVAALAQPWWLTDGRQAAAAERLVRAVVVDVSAGMLAAGPDGRTGADAARTLATALAEEADASRTIETADIAEGLAAATAWLTARGGTREVIVVSDFQRGSIDAAHASALPADIGARFVRVPASAPETNTLALDHPAQATRATLAFEDDSVAIGWEAAPAAADAGDVRIESAAEHAAVLRAIADAARRLTTSSATGGPTTVVLPGAAARASLVANSRAIDAPWMFDFVDALRRDPAVIDAATTPSGPSPDTDSASGLLPVVTALDGRPLVRAAAIRDGGGDRLLLALEVGPDHPLTAAVLGSAAAGTAAPGAPVPASEFDPRRIDDATLASWTRPATPVPATAEDLRGSSDGRWLWFLVLALLAVETWARRAWAPAAAPARQTTPTEASRARVA